MKCHTFYEGQCYICYFDSKGTKILNAPRILCPTIGTSIKVGCASRSLYASSGPKAKGVPTDNQKGRGSGPCRF